MCRGVMHTFLRIKFAGRHKRYEDCSTISIPTERGHGERPPKQLDVSLIARPCVSLRLGCASVPFSSS